VKKLNVDIKKSLNFVSPIYKILISSVARYIYQDPKLYSDIQIFNEEILEVHDAFTKSAIDFNKFVKEKNSDDFISTANDIKDYF